MIGFVKCCMSCVTVVVGQRLCSNPEQKQKGCVQHMWRAQTIRVHAGQAIKNSAKVHHFKRQSLNSGPSSLQ